MINRILYLDFLKGFSIFFVVLLHVSALGLSMSPIGSFSWEVSNIIDSSCRFVVPVFVMISGALLMDKVREFNLYKSLMRLFFPLSLWSFFYAFVVVAYHSKSISLESLSALLKLTFLIPTHNWFLFMLIGIYLLIPLIKAVIKGGREKYFIVLWVIWGVLIPFLKNFEFLIPLENYLNRFSITMPLGYIGYFVIGHKLHSMKFTTNKYTNYILVFISISLIIFNAIGTHIMSVRFEYTSEIFYNYLSPLVLVYSICIFILAKTCLADKNYSPKNQNYNIIFLMSKYSLAIYMFHEFLLIFIQKLGVNPMICPSLVSIPIIAFVIYVISLLSTKNRK